MKYLIIGNEHSSRVIIDSEENLLKLLKTHESIVKDIKSKIDVAYQEYLYESRRPASDFGITKTKEARERLTNVSDKFDGIFNELIKSYDLYSYDLSLQEAITAEEFLNTENKLDLLIDN